MTINQSDFETAHTKKFDQFGKQTLKLEKGQKKILIIGPQSDFSAAERSFMAPALGVIRLAGYLNKKGHHAEHYEPNIHMLTNEGISLEEMLKKHEWDVIGFSVLEETLINDVSNAFGKDDQIISNEPYLLKLFNPIALSSIISSLSSTFNLSKSTSLFFKYSTAHLFISFL